MQSPAKNTRPAIDSAANGSSGKRDARGSPSAKRKRTDSDQTPSKSAEAATTHAPLEEVSKKQRLDDASAPAQKRVGPTSSQENTQTSGPSGESAHDPSPPPRSPPRKLKRPTARAALSHAEVEAIRKRREEREQQEHVEHRPEQGVSEFVKQHYNAVPERDRNWRKTDSKIKGLRAFNNWIKSCLIRKFTPHHPGVTVLDMGCGKGGDLQKWKSQRIAHYIGLDQADVSIGQAWERYREMSRRGGGRFKASFHVIDCYAKSIQEVDQVRDVGFDAHLDPRWTKGGFDVVSMMFCMHYAFESEAKARTMLRNVVGALKKGGTFIGVIPNSDVLAQKIQEHYRRREPTATAAVEEEDDDDWDPEKSVDEQEKEKKAANGGAEESSDTDEIIEWGNDIYHVKFPGRPPKDGVFRPPFGWKYFYFLEEAVEEVPEYVVPWGVFRGLAEDFNLTLNYMEPFSELYNSQRHDREGAQLAERMGVFKDGQLAVSEQEMDAANFYIAFAFTKL